MNVRTFSVGECDLVILVDLWRLIVGERSNTEQDPIPWSWTEHGSYTSRYSFHASVHCAEA